MDLTSVKLIENVDYLSKAETENKRLAETLGIDNCWLDDNSKQDKQLLDGTIVTNDTRPADYLIQNKKKLEGYVKTDHYWTADNKNQFISSHETKPIQFKHSSVSFALGTDYLLNTSRRKDKDVVDVYYTLPLSENLSFKGRSRTKHWDAANFTSQLRGGLEYSFPITYNDSLYTQAYVAEKMDRKGKSREENGFFTGILHNVSKTGSIYLEAQVYDFDDLCKENYGINLGYKCEW